MAERPGNQLGGALAAKDSSVSLDKEDNKNRSGSKAILSVQIQEFILRLKTHNTQHSDHFGEDGGSQLILKRKNYACILLFL